MRRLLTLPVTISVLAFAPNMAAAARVCIAGHFHYGGSELHHDRVRAEQAPYGLGERSRHSRMGQKRPPVCIQAASSFIANTPPAMRAGVVSYVVVPVIRPERDQCLYSAVRNVSLARSVRGRRPNDDYHAHQ